VLIYGTVTDAQGQAVPGARVSAATSMITNTPNATFVTETLTDSTGQYSLLTLSGTNYTLVTCPSVTGLDSVPLVPETMRLAPVIMHQQWWHADL
jgi:hypothetical protein